MRADGILGKVIDHGGADEFGGGEHYRNDDNAHEQIYKAACGNDYEALPRGLVAECVFVFAVLILALHADEAAYREEPEGIFCLALFEFEQRRAHAHGKFIDLDLEYLGKGKMPQLVKEYQQPEEQHGDKYRPRLAPYLSRRHQS